MRDGFNLPSLRSRFKAKENGAQRAPFFMVREQGTYLRP